MNFLKIMLVDMNSFFASVEQQANPFFRGRPLGVCASLHETSCLIAASKEAKSLGIKTGTLIYLAKKICPKIILCQSEPEKYREVNRKMNQIFLQYTNDVEEYSIDESFLDFTEAKINPVVAGVEIKQRIRQEVGEWLTCSVGIAPNKFMAKLAADLEKPDGLSIVWRSQLPEIYKSKKLTDLWGINRGWENRLAKLGITSPLQLLNYPVTNLVALFGKPGFYLWQRVNGLEEDGVRAFNGRAARIGESFASGEPPSATEKLYAQCRPVTRDDLPKSFGHSWVLNFRTTDKEKLKPAVLRLAEKAARRMRQAGLLARAMYFSITLTNGRYFHRSKRLGYTIETGQSLYEEALKIWQPWKFDINVMHVAVGFSQLASKVSQLSLFPDKYEHLTPVLDAINDKYGEFTIRSSLLTKTSDFAPDAIAFGR